MAAKGGKGRPGLAPRRAGEARPAVPAPEAVEAARSRSTGGAEHQSTETPEHDSPSAKPHGVRNLVWRKGRGDEPGRWESRVVCYLPPGDRKALDMLAAREGIDLSEIVAEGIRRELRRRGEE